jgi:hypothetical protein
MSERLAELKEKLRHREDKPGWKASADKIREEIARLEALNEPV